MEKLFVPICKQTVFNELDGDYLSIEEIFEEEDNEDE